MPMSNHVWSPFQVLQPIVTAMATAEAAIPAREPYIVAQEAEGAAYRQLPTPKGAVLTSITATVADLNTKITTVSNAELCCI
jgi:cellobiose phosphorylase